MARNIDMKKAKALIEFTIDNNIRRQANGKIPIALGFEATAGIGKTSLVQQVAEERGMQYVKVNLHEMDEAGD